MNGSDEMKFPPLICRRSVSLPLLHSHRSHVSSHWQAKIVLKDDCVKNTRDKDTCWYKIDEGRTQNGRYIMSLPTYVNLNNGQKIPRVGLGTWQAKEEEVKAAIECALEVGYRHIDTAFNYTNEETIGKVLKEWLTSEKIKRDELFVTTKLPHLGNRASDVAKYLDKSLKRLQLDYIDLYLVHHPFAFMPDCNGEVPAAAEDGTWILDTDTDHLAVWKALEEQVKEGKIKGIGLSNFNVSQIDRIIKNANIHPVVLQVELHAYFQQKDLRLYCKDQGITVIAYSPLGSPGAKEHFMKKYNYSPNKFPNVLGTPIVQDLAAKYMKTPAQILLRHLVQSDIIVIPKSKTPERIKQNIEIFDYELSVEEMKELDKLDQGEDGRIFDFMCWKGVQNHPEYPFKNKIS